MECGRCEYYKAHNCKRQCMDLPEGKTCTDCVHVARCTSIFGAKPENNYCGFEPVRFVEKKKARDDMYTAKEARAKAEESISEETEEQLTLVEKYINSAVGQGEMSCWYGKKLGKQAIRQLEKLGYKVADESNQRDGVSYKISWEG